MKPLATALGFALLAAPAFGQDNYLSKTAERDLRELREWLPGTYSNEEQVYFEGNLERSPEFRHDRNTLYVTEGADGLSMRYADRVLPIVTTEDKGFISLVIGDCTFEMAREGERFYGGTRSPECRGQTLNLTEVGLFINNAPRQLTGGRNPDSALPAGDFLRADAFTCWVAPQKRDGEYAFRNDIILHDGGGRKWIAGKDFDTVGLRMRHVRWPSGNNRDSLVLYVHKGDDTEWSRAESYAWTEPDADRIAVNLRWVQASCTRGGEIVMPGLDLNTGAGN